MSSREYESIEAYAERVGLSTRTIRRRIADGTIAGYRAGPKAVRIDPEEADAALLRRIPSGGEAA